MARQSSINATTILSFFVGGLIGVGVALLIALEPGQVQARIKSVVGRRKKPTREQIIEEGTQCAVPEGIDMCYPGPGERA